MGWCSWTQIKTLFTPGLIKVLGIIFFLDVVSFSGTVYQYLSLINLYELIDDTTTYVKIVAFTQTVLNIPASLLMEKLFRIEPGIIVPGLYIVQGTSLFAYGLIMYQDTWSPWVRLTLSYAATIPLHFAANLNRTYVDKHLLICLSRKNGVKLGVLNSAKQVLGAFTGGLQILIVGQIYLCFSLEDASLYMTGFSFLLSLVMGLAARPLFEEYSAIPSRKASPATVLSNLKVQLRSFWDLKIYKIMLSEVLDTATIGGNYVMLFLLGAGLSEVTYTYISAFTKVSVVVSCLLNIVKYKYSWGTRYAEWFVFGHCLQLYTCLYIFGAWLYVSWFPWLNGDEVLEAEDMPTWMVVYFVISLSIGWIRSIMGLIKQEFFQEMIPAEDRGSIAGVKMFLCLMIMLILTTVNLLLPNDYVYLVNFSLTVVTDLTTLAVVVSYKRDQDRERVRYDRLVPEGSMETVPLKGEEVDVFRRKMLEDFEK